ncbi:hypothetical protein [Halorubrum salsamenti]|uniref:hypothetical protein n=1 Tax=Halorubrum salsamenti TaxID=2583990 RepID=UPI00119FF24E|nr:hypothetical protein [Halorubrum salsamenti]
MATGLLKALLQTANYFRNWRNGDPESAIQRGRKYLFWILVGGVAILWILYQQGIAVPVDFAMFTGGLLLVDMFQFGTLLRIGMAVDPLVGGILGTIGLGTLAKFFRDLGGLSAAINYFFSIW